MPDSLLTYNIFYPLIALLLIVISTSFLGVFTLWQKLSYFGDALSHSIILGVVIANLFVVNQILAIIIFCLCFCIIFYQISNNKFFSKDAITMILSYFCLSLAFIFNEDPQKLHHFIFGNLNEIDLNHLILLAILAVICLTYCKIAFKKLLQINVNNDLAQIDGINVRFWQLSFLIILSVTIALSVKAVGVFLMSALLILPAAISRIFSKSPQQMLLLTFILSIIITIISYNLSLILKFQSGAFIILSFFTIFILSLLLIKAKNHD